MNSLREIRNAEYVSAGLALTTLLVYTSQVSDPVNAPKFLLMGFVSFTAIAVLLIPHLKKSWSEFKLIFITSGFMLFFMCLSVAKSQSPFMQNIYGVQGRNTGLLNNLALLGILLSMLGISSLRSFKVIFFGLLFAGLGNLLYCLWVLFFGDFIDWTNPYKSLLGTLGNPNFVSSFLAIAATGFLGYFLSYKISTKKILLGSSLFVIVLIEIYNTRSTQGLVVLLFGAYLVTFFYLKLELRRRLLTLGWGVIGLIASTFGLMGLVNMGPLASALYQETLAFRKEYWLAGINMGLKFPLTGVGMDAYGDWYRQLRTIKSVVTPGVNVITNVSHNIYIDAFANGGIPLLVSYLVFSGFALKSILSSLRSVEKLDPLLVGISVSWLCFQLQSLISINQIGISIWGWALTGMLIAYPRVKSSQLETSKLASKSPKRKVTTEYLLRPAIASIAGVLAFILYSPPVLADHKWTVAYSHKNADELMESLEEAYFSPSNSFKYAQAIQIFESSNLPEQAHKLALRATNFNPRSFDAWQMLYSVRNSSTSERELALKKMIELDPLNRSLKELGR